MKLENFLEHLKIEEGMFLRNCVIYPLTDGGKIDFSIKTLDEGFKDNTVLVRELPSSKIGEIEIINRSPDKLFLLDGEEIIGALQNRITNTAALIAENTSVKMPVTCVEEGRWEGNKEFKKSLLSSHPRLRAILCKGVTESLKKTKSFKGPQQEVWEEVTRKITSFKVKSTTSSLHDVYETLKEDVERYLEEVEGLKGYNGFVAYVGNKFLGFEYFYDKKFFEKFIHKLLRGYALDALEIQKPTSFEPIYKIRKFLEELYPIQLEKYPSVALGEEYRFVTKKYTGRISLFEGKPLQASVFSTS